MEGGLLYPPSVASLSDADSNDMSYAYSDFVTEVAVYVRELREATVGAEVDRYQPIVANIISCVKALLIFTNTIARDSEVLQTYSEMAKSRRTILRALGKLYSKCRVANGSQAMTTARQRQFAAEKLGIFANQVLSGITEFTTRAREIGLQMITESAAATTARGGELDMVLMASTGDITGSSPPTSLSITHSRPRRRVSRANSAKGYKSFNAVRQWKAEHQLKHNAAKQAVEQLLSEYMECLSEANGSTRLDRILAITIQTAQAVEIFIMSADEMRSRGNVKDDQDYTTLRARLSTTSNELYEYIKFLGPRGYSDESILNNLMSMGTILLKCLIDMEPHAPGSRRGSIAPKQEPEMPKVPAAVLMASSVVNTIVGQKDTQESRPAESELLCRSPSSKNAPTSRSKHAGNSNRKFGSLNSLNERYRRQGAGQTSPDRESAQPNSETTHGEGNDQEEISIKANRSNHDSAVVVSARVTPHQNLVNPQKGAIITVPITEESEGGSAGLPGKPCSLIEVEFCIYRTVDWTFTRRYFSPDILGHETSVDARNKNAGEQGEVARDAERKIAAFIMPATEVSQMKEEIGVPTSHSSRHRFEQDPDAPPTPSLRPQYTSQSSSSIAGSRSPRTRATDSSSRSPGRRGMSNRNERPRSPVAAKPESNANAKDSDRVGLGVSVPTETRQRSSTATSRTSRTTGSRSPVPPSPNPEASKRMQRQEQPRPHSPNPSSDLRPFSRNSNHSNTSFNPAGMPSSRRGSQTSIRSDGTVGRRSNDSQRSKDHEHQDRRQQPNQSGSRRGSNSGSTLRVEQHTKGDDVLSGLSTPSTPHVQTFVDGSSHRSGRNLHRESIQSNLSVATESSVQSRTSENRRPVSPAPRNRNVQLEDGSTKGRVSNESNRGGDKQQHHPPQSQQAKGASGATYRPRPNKVGQDNTAVSNEDSKLETALSEPWFLNHDYEADEVLYNDNGTFVAATLEAYIEMLTSHKNTPGNEHWLRHLSSIAGWVESRKY